MCKIKGVQQNHGYGPNPYINGWGALFRNPAQVKLGTTIFFQYYYKAIANAV